MPNLLPVLLCGGAGTRLWPLSRSQYPKQFLRLTGADSLLQDTVRRVLPLVGDSRLLAIANEDHRFLLAEQLHELGIAVDILLEPVARNTAPAIAAAAHWASRDGSTPLLLVLPSDHLIADCDAFARAVQAGVPLAAAGQLVTFGIVPDRPETGYGYIRRGPALGAGFAIDRFVEKPDSATAQSYLESGDYYWNSGMFLFRADVYLHALASHRPEIDRAALAAVGRAVADLDFVRLDAAAFAASPSDSIDYAVMEQTRDGVVIPLDAGWNDIGAWDALCAVGPADPRGNRTQGDVLLQDTEDCYVRAEGRLVATVGVRDLVVVETGDAVLVADRAKAQEVKQIVARLKDSQRAESEFHTRVHRPWGAYEGIDQGERYQVKRITVKPGRSLSLQQHHHRAEHWVVVKGTARVTRGEEILLLAENESTYIPLGVVHRLENPGKIDLEIIEVQSGAYLGEDDIVRFEDHYGRAT